MHVGRVLPVGEQGLAGVLCCMEGESRSARARALHVG